MITLPKLVAQVASDMKLSHGDVLKDSELMCHFVDVLQEEGYQCQLVERQVALVHKACWGMRLEKDRVFPLLVLQSGDEVFDLGGVCGWDNIVQQYIDTHPDFEKFIWKTKSEQGDSLSWYAVQPEGLGEAVRAVASFHDLNSQIRVSSQTPSAKKKKL